MAKIIAPNKQYTGVSASVIFVNGVGETDDPHLINWFKAHGYEVEQDEQVKEENSNKGHEEEKEKEELKQESTEPKNKTTSKKG